MDPQNMIVMVYNILQLSQSCSDSVYYMIAFKCMLISFIKYFIKHRCHLIDCYIMCGSGTCRQGVIFIFPEAEHFRPVILSMKRIRVNPGTGQRPQGRSCVVSDGWIACLQLPYGSTHIILISDAKVDNYQNRRPSRNFLRSLSESQLVAVLLETPSYETAVDKLMCGAKHTK